MYLLKDLKEARPFKCIVLVEKVNIIIQFLICAQVTVLWILFSLSLILR